MADYISKDGHLYTIDEVNQAAEENNLTAEEILKENGLVPNEDKKPAASPGKPNPVVKKGANAAGTKNTASRLDPSSLGSQKTPFSKVKLFDPKERNLRTKKFNPSLSDTSINFGSLDNTKKQDASAPKTGLGSSSVMWRASNQKAIDKKIAEDNATKEKQIELDKTFPAREKSAKDEISFNNPTKVLKYDLEGDSPVETVQNLNKKLNRLGISVEENTFDNKLHFTVLNAPSKLNNNEVGSLSPSINYSVEGVSFDPKDDKSINEYISKFGNKNYLEDVKQRVAKVAPNYLEKITPPSLSNEEKLKRTRNSLIEGFKKIDELGSIKQGYGYGVAATSKDITKEDFNSPEDYKLYKEWKKNPNALLAIPEYKVESWDKKRKDDFVKTASRDLSRQLPENVRKDLEILSQEAINENKIEAQKFNLAGEKLNERSRNYKKNYDAFIKNPTPEGKTLLDEEYISLINEQNNLQTWQKDLAEKTKTTNEVIGPAIQNFGANYNRLSQLTTGLKKTAIDVISAFDDIAAYGSAAILGKTQDEVMKADTLGISYMAKELAKKQAEYQSSIGINEIRNFSDAGNWLMGGVVNNVPSVAMAFTGPAAMPLFFANGYGGKASQMQLDVDNAKIRLSENYDALNYAQDEFQRSFIKNQIKADEEMLALPAYKKLAAKTIYGSAEVAFEALGTLSIMKGLGDATKMLPKKTLMDGLLWAGETGVKNLNREGASEFATTTSGNFADIYILGENKNMFEGGLESYAQGGVFGVAFGINQSAKVIKRAYVSELATKSQARRIQEITNQIIKITNNFCNASFAHSRIITVITFC